jgi:hypothetical protein
MFELLDHKLAASCAIALNGFNRMNFARKRQIRGALHAGRTF